MDRWLLLTSHGKGSIRARHSNGSVSLTMTETRECPLSCDSFLVAARELITGTVYEM